jgi:aminoglycoside 3-N-acetyltransferase
VHKTKLSDIEAVLSSIPIDSAKPLIFVHSGLFPFGIIEGGVPAVCKLLLDWIGPNGTLAMPAFTFKAREIWYQKNTPSEMGVLTEYFRKLPGACRTIHPIHSVSVLGAQAEYLVSDIDASSFGEMSIFEKLVRLKSVNISLGTEFEGGATFLHYIEELAKVPYRNYVEIKSKVFNDANKEVEKKFKYFARLKNNDYEWENNWPVVFDDFIKERLIDVRKIGPAKIMYSNMHCAGNYLLRKLEGNPLYCAKKIEDDIEYVK